MQTGEQRRASTASGAATCRHVRRLRQDFPSTVNDGIVAGCTRTATFCVTARFSRGTGSSSICSYGQSERLHMICDVCTQARPGPGLLVRLVDDDASLKKNGPTAHHFCPRAMAMTALNRTGSQIFSLEIEFRI